MRDATKEERESVNKYIKSISKPTWINFFAILENGSTIQLIEPKQPVKRGQRAKMCLVDNFKGEDVDMNNHLEQYSKEQIKKNLETILKLEYLGVHIENTKELKDEFGLETIIGYYFTVPEFSTIEVENKELNEKVKTSDGLISLTKELLIEMCIDTFKDVSEDDDFTKEIIEDLKNNPSEYLKFYAKVRKGETWNKEMGKVAIDKINKELELVSGYKEV